MLSNPPYGKSWKTDLERMGGKIEMRGGPPAVAVGPAPLLELAADLAGQVGQRVDVDVRVA
jgi:type I restriction-modification system DNA methylase subunit